MESGEMMVVGAGDGSTSVLKVGLPRSHFNIRYKYLVDKRSEVSWKDCTAWMVHKCAYTHSQLFTVNHSVFMRVSEFIKEVRSMLTDVFMQDNFLNIWWPMTLFSIFISAIGIETSTFLYTVMLIGGCLVVWTWRGPETCLLKICIDVIVVRVKISRGIEPFSSMGIDSADTSLLPNEEILIDKSRVHPNYPARQ